MLVFRDRGYNMAGDLSFGTHSVFVMSKIAVNTKKRRVAQKICVTTPQGTGNHILYGGTVVTESALTSVKVPQRYGNSSTLNMFYIQS